MPSEPFNPEYTKIRRSKKAINDEGWIKTFLHKAPVGMLATVYQDQPFLSAKLFVYDEARHVIWLHSANEGRVMENILLNPKVCFSAYKMGRLLPAPQARSFGVEYESVVVFGLVDIVRESNEIIAVLLQFMQKYSPQFEPGRDYPLIQENELGGLAIYRIEIQGWSAKSAQGDMDHPGAYFYEDNI